MSLGSLVKIKNKRLKEAIVDCLRLINYDFQSSARNASPVLDVGCGEKDGYLVMLARNIWGVAHGFGH